MSVTSGSSQVGVGTPSGKDKLSLAMQKASLSIKPLSNKKRTFEEQLVEISECVITSISVVQACVNANLVFRKNMAIANKRLAQERQEKHQKLSLKKREMLLEEHHEGLITRDEYRCLVYGSSAALDIAMRGSSPLFNDDLGVGGSDDVVGNGWEQ